MEYLCKNYLCMIFMTISKLSVRGDIMSDWNEQAAPNNNIPPRIVRPYERRDQKVDHEFSEELADGGERDDFIQHQKKIKK
jgi:hypothetical protein